jgi:hypothetical protein
VVPKVCSADMNGSATHSPGIRGYISILATVKYNVLLKITADRLSLAICLVPMTVKTSN